MTDEIFIVITQAVVGREILVLYTEQHLLRAITICILRCYRIYPVNLYIGIVSLHGGVL